MITVMHVIDTGGPGGAETVFLHLAAGLDRARYRSICVVSRDGWLATALRQRGIEPVILPASGSMNLGYLRKLLRIARRERVDLMAAHLYGSAIYCGLAGLLSSIPVISILHGQSDMHGGGRLAAVKKLLVRRSRHLVFVSEKLRVELAAALNAQPSRTVVIPNGVDMAKFAGAADDSIRKQLQLRGTDVLVGAVGNIRVPKAYDIFLRAAHILRQRSDKWHFVIAGEGGNALHEELLLLRQQLGLQEVVTFLGLRSDVARILNNLDIYTSSSRTEGFSLTCVEAMSAGIPVVATRSGGPEEIIEHGLSGLLVPVDDPTALADEIERLADDPGLAKELCHRASQRVLNRYTLEAMVGAYERLFYSVAVRRSGT